MYISTPYKIVYDTKKFPFKEVVKEMLQVESLEKLHELEHYDVLEREKDQSTKWHRAYYDNFAEKFYPLYVEFVNHIKERFGYEEIVYQRIPTFRAHLVENLGVAFQIQDDLLNL